MASSRRRAAASTAHRATTRLRSAAAGSAGAPQLRIVSVNDVYELDALPRLRTLIAAARAAEPRTAFCSVLCGDFVSPSVLSGLDGGRGMVAALNRVPIDYCCFGNHEADIPLAALRERTREFRGTWLNTNVGDFEPTLPRHAIIDVLAQGAPLRIGLLGLLTSERGIFRSESFRGYAIGDVLDAARREASRLREECGVGYVIALTHQSVGADAELAADGHVDLILGGHEHEVMEVRADGVAPIVKSGSDALTAAIVDVCFDDGGPRVAVRFEPTADHAPDAHLAAEVAEQQAVLLALQREIVFSADDTAPFAAPPRRATGAPTTLSSRGSRFRQTSVGAMLASAARDALQADVGAINGGPIKGNREYADGAVSYMQLQQELPFPTKMVVVRLPGAVMQEAVRHSRTGEGERRAFLQLDAATRVGDDGVTLTEIRGAPFDPRAEYAVAMPRNLLKGAFNVAPLVEFARASPHALPDDDAFIPAFNLVLMHQSRRIWRRLGDFNEIDLDGNGELDRDEVAEALRAKLGSEPSAMLIDRVVAALDVDASGTISRDEYESARARYRADPTCTSGQCQV